MRIGILALGAVLLACGIATGITREVKVDKAAPAPAVKSVVKPVKAAAQLTTHKVANGESDWTIAKKFGTTVHNLHLANPGIDWPKLQIGRTLSIPESWIQAKQLSGKVAAKATGAPAKTASVSKGTYTVREGENDWVIANRLGITRPQLFALNPGVSWAKLQIGTKLVVPKGKIQNAAASNVIRTRYAVVTGNAVSVRRGAKSSSELVTRVDAGTRVTVLDRMGSWHKLKFPRGTVGWVRGDLLKGVSATQVASNSKTSKSKSKSTAKKSSGGTSKYSSKSVVAMKSSTKDIVEKAYTYRGVRYSYGSASRSATDCSGLTTQVYKAAGVALPRTSAAQAKVGQQVSKDGLKKGDLVFFKTNRGTRINHVGIYVGEGKFIHASSGGGKVKVDNLNDGYYDRRYAGGRRVATPAAKAAPKAEAPKKEAAKADTSADKPKDEKAGGEG